MKIILTNHALLRCRQQSLDSRNIVESIRAIPKVTRDIRWRLPDGTQVVVEKRDNKIIIVTVIAKKRQKNKKMRKSLGRGDVSD